MLTKFPVELIRGNGDANMFVAYNGEGMDVSNITVEPGVKIGAIDYDRDNGILKLTIVDGATDLAITPIASENIIDQIEIKGFVRLSDLKKGMQGKNGRSGKTGINGLNGVDGQKGIRGPRGFRGLRGVQGLPGPRGVQGLRGDQGYKGQRGERGLTGIKGQIGEKGQQGDAGTDGRNSFLPISVGNTDPGAIGAGGLWVKPSGFTYEQDKDHVPFTISENKETLICYDTIQMLTSIQQTGITPEWFSRGITTDSNSYTYNLTFRSACLSGNNIVLVAESDSVDGRTTVVLMNDFLYNLEQLFINPKCYYDQYLYIAHNNGIVRIDDDVIKVVDFDLNVCGYCIIGDTHYIAADTGLYTYKTKLMRLYEDCFESIFVYNGQCYATTLKETYVDPEEAAYDKKCIVDQNIICYELDGYLLNVYSLDNVLLYSAYVDSVHDQIAIKGNSVFAITSFGLKFITDTQYNVVMCGNYLIEYDDNVMFIELR